MREVVPDVYLIEGLRGANVYVLDSDDGGMLVDTGLTSDVPEIVAQLQKGEHSPNELRGIVLTHAHGDHTGGAAALAHRSGAQVIAHRDDAPLIEGTRPLQSGSFVARVLIWLGEHLLFRTPTCQVDRAVEDGDVIGALGGLEVVHTPGHTPGSICLYQASRRILFCGDALFNSSPMTGQPGLALPLRLVSADNAQARESVRRLSELAVDVLCCGHGEPILTGANRKIAALVEDASG